MKILRVKYLTPKGKEITAKFLRTSRGYIPVIIDKIAYLDKSNKIIDEEELDFEDIRKEMFL